MEQQTNVEMKNEQIELMAVVTMTWRNLWKILLAGVVVALLAFRLMPGTSTTAYLATTEMYVYEITDEGLSSNSDIIATSVELTKDSSVLNEAAKLLNAEVDADDLSARLTVQKVSTTSILRITVSAETEEKATEQVEAVRNAAVKKIPKMIQNRVVCSAGDTVTVTSSTFDNSADVKKNTLLCGFIAMVVVFAVLLWREFFAGKVNNAKDAAYATHLPVIGTIPDMRSVSGTKNYFHDGNQGGKAQKAYSEAYRSLRTNFLYRAKKNAWKSFLITSSVQKEDEYNVASNLGLALAEAGKKTIVVDCNMRRGELNNYLHFNHSVGLSQVLTGEAQWAEAISEVDDSDLKAICSGKSENPSELLSNSAMEQLLAELKNKYEYVLLVAPNAAGVTDASVLGAISDGVVLVTRIRFAKMDTIRMAMGNLKSVNSNIIGVVLTKMVVRKQYGNQAYAEVQKRSF